MADVKWKYTMEEHTALAISKIKFNFNAGCKKMGIEWRCGNTQNKI
jgi:hypothetical protein